MKYVKQSKEAHVNPLAASVQTTKLPAKETLGRPQKQHGLRERKTCRGRLIRARRRLRVSVCRWKSWSEIRQRWLPHRAARQRGESLRRRSRLCVQREIKRLFVSMCQNCNYTARTFLAKARYHLNLSKVVLTKQPIPRSSYPENLHQRLCYSVD